MKYFYFISILLIVLFCGCNDSAIRNEDGIEISYLSKEDLTIVDGCEYIKVRTYQGYLVLCHKGDCKKCWNRMEKLIKENSKIELEKR